MIDLLSLQEKAEKATPGVHEARYVKSQMPVDCVKYGVISKHTGYETCRVWTREDVEFYAAASPETILSLCSELSAARENKWISVKRELPPCIGDLSVIVMGWYGKSFDFMRYNQRKEKWVILPHHRVANNEVIMWHPLPQLPEAPIDL